VISTRKSPRILTLSLPDDKQPILLYQDTKFLIRNFSETGVGIWLPHVPPFSLTQGSEITAELKIADRSFKVSLRLMHYTARVGGFEFKEIPSDLKAVLIQILEPSRFTRGMVQEAGSGEMDTLVGLPRLWYKAPGLSELMVWYQPPHRSIWMVQLCWSQHWIQRKQFESPLSGVLEKSQACGVGQLLSMNELSLVHSPADLPLLKEAAQILGALPPPLPGYLLWQFLETGEQVFLPDLPPKRSNVA